MDKRCVIPAGAVFMVSEGCYSDYTVLGTYITSEDIDVDQIVASRRLKNMQLWGEQRDVLLSEVTSLPCVREINVGELHLGDYQVAPDYTGRPCRSHNELKRRLKMFDAADGEMGDG